MDIEYGTEQKNSHNLWASGTWEAISLVTVFSMYAMDWKRHLLHSRYCGPKIITIDVSLDKALHSQLHSEV